MSHAESPRFPCACMLFGSLFAAIALSSACGSMHSGEQGPPALEPGTDGGLPDGGNPGNPDGGNPDGGQPDGGTPDGGIQFGGPGPWPIDNVTYGRNQGLLETPIVGTSTDETQNLWVASHAALYLLKPGDARFRRYTSADGLHLQTNPVVYCDQEFGGGDHRCPIYGAATDPGISEIVGGGPNEVFVGYYGDLRGTRDWFDPNRHSGMIDRVRLRADGTLQVDRFDMVYGVGGPEYWYNGTVSRMFYDHFVHPHELYAGCNHGVTRFRPEQFRYARPGEWLFTVNLEWMADHIHPYVCYHTRCVDASGHMMGDWRGLAMGPDGNIWVAGRWTAGKIFWSQDLAAWMNRIGEQTFQVTFGDPYVRPVPEDALGYFNEPVFRPPMEGDPVNLSAVSVAPDGRVWFASGPTYDGPLEIAYGVAVWNGSAFRVYNPVVDIGMEERVVRDLIALPDGRILLAGPSTGLVLWNPATGAHQSLRAPAWLADDRVQRLELDKMVSPPALHVSTEYGATVIRRLP